MALSSIENCAEGFLNVRRQDLEPHRFRFIDENHQLRIFFFADGAVADFAGEQRRHEFDRVVGLQIRGLIGHQAVGRAVRFVEAVAAEGHDLLKDLMGGFFFDAFGFGPFHEQAAQLFDFFRNLFPHGLAQDVRLSRA